MRQKAKGMEYSNERKVRKTGGAQYFLPSAFCLLPAVYWLTESYV